ncbi:low temperature requirement protein A [Glaciibacter superstes]|uniref:low temperature requirement protein A n=1 Tax=Glaciibacter superstes TaxID=501023 RepID=UPI001FDEAA63|nr:low temperature requirement protein A [Glaciibacter superstes]
MSAMPLQIRSVARLVPMRPRDPDQPTRAAMPLGLFFDLVFVVAVGQAAVQLHHALVEDHVLDGLTSFLVAFFRIWWAWMNFTWYGETGSTNLGWAIGESGQTDVGSDTNSCSRSLCATARP